MQLAGHMKPHRGKKNCNIYPLTSIKILFEKNDPAEVDRKYPDKITQTCIPFQEYFDFTHNEMKNFFMNEDETVFFLQILT